MSFWLLLLKVWRFTRIVWNWVFVDTVFAVSWQSCNAPYKWDSVRRRIPGRAWVSSAKAVCYGGRRSHCWVVELLLLLLKFSILILPTLWYFCSDIRCFQFWVYLNRFLDYFDNMRFLSTLQITERMIVNFARCFPLFTWITVVSNEVPGIFRF